MVRYHAGQCLLPGFDLTLYRRASISAYAMLSKKGSTKASNTDSC